MSSPRRRKKHPRTIYDCCSCLWEKGNKRAYYLAPPLWFFSFIQQTVGECLPCLKYCSRNWWFREKVYVLLNDCHSGREMGRWRQGLRVMKRRETTAMTWVREAGMPSAGMETLRYILKEEQESVWQRAERKWWAFWGGEEQAEQEQRHRGEINAPRFGGGVGRGWWGCWCRQGPIGKITCDYLLALRHDPVQAIMNHWRAQAEEWQYYQRNS